MEEVDDIDAEVDDFLSSLDPELLKGVVDYDEDQDETDDKVGDREDDDEVEEFNVETEKDDEAASKILLKQKELHIREEELDAREKRLRDLVRKIQKKQILLHEKQTVLEMKETELLKRERAVANEASRMGAREKVVMDGLGQAAIQEANMKRWLNELEKTKHNLKKAEVEWLRRTKTKMFVPEEEEEEEEKSTKQQASSKKVPSAAEILQDTPQLHAFEDSPDSDAEIHTSCVGLKTVSSFLVDVFESFNEISKRIASTCTEISKLTSLLKMSKEKENLIKILGSRSFKELQRFDNALIQLQQFLELLGHSLSQAVARPLSDVVNNGIEDALALHLRLQEDRVLLDNAIERLLNTRLVKRSTSDGVVASALQNLFGATNLGFSGGDHASSKSAVKSLQYQWRLRRFDAIAASNLTAKHVRVRVVEAAASGLLAMQAFISQTSSALGNVGQFASPLLSSCQSATSILTSSAQRDRVEREQLQAETTWQASYKEHENDDDDEKQKTKVPTPVKTGLSERECILKGYLRLRTRSKGLNKRCWFEITNKGMMKYRKHWREPVKPLVDLLLCAIRSCDDFAEPFPFGFEIHTPKKRYFFQARSDEERRCWVKTLRNAASARLATHTKSTNNEDDNNTKVTPSSDQIRHKNLLKDLKARLMKLNPRCADCGDANPDWVCLNFGVLVCHQCSGIHRSLDSAFVRSLELDTINALELRMMEACGGNDEANKIWEAQAQSGWISPSVNSKMEERKRWIHAKYVWGGFTKPCDETREEWSKSVLDAASSGNFYVLLECLARRKHVSTSDDEEDDGTKVLMRNAARTSKDGGHILCERLLLMYAS